MFDATTDISFTMLISRQLLYAAADIIAVTRYATLRQRRYHDAAAAAAVTRRHVCCRLVTPFSAIFDTLPLPPATLITPCRRRCCYAGAAAMLHNRIHIYHIIYEQHQVYHTCH